MAFLLLPTLTKGQSDCDALNVLTDPFGSISFQGQSPYGGWEVDWKIIAPAGHTVDIQLISYNIVTCVPPKEKCTCHFLNVKDGECSNASIIGTYCDYSDVPKRLSSTGRYLRLEFISDSDDTSDYFTATYAAAMKCPTRYGYPEKCPSSIMFNTECCYGNGTGGCCYYDGNRCHSGTTNTTRDYCPRLQDNSSQKICCVASGEPSCCVSGGNRCHGNVNFRDYCPGPREGFDKTICCSFQGQESCCSPGGNVCHDAGKNIRSYCPSPGHSLEETECCLKQDNPSCCKPPPPQLACGWFLKGHGYNNALCVTIWVIFGLGFLVSIILGIMACKKWPFYHCLANPLWDCLDIFWKQFKRFFRFLVRMFKIMLFYASLVFTTIFYTFACCFCFVVIQEWPWVMAYRHVSKKFNLAEIPRPRCCRRKQGYQNIN